MKIESETVTKNSIFDKETWQLKKQELLKKFPQLTEADLTMEDGKEDGVFERIHTKIGVAIGKTKEGLHKFIEAL